MALLSSEARTGGPQRLGHPGKLERQENLVRLLLIEPSDHVSHRCSGGRRREEQRGEELLCVRVPETGILQPPIPRSGNRAQGRGDAPCARPGHRPGEGRPSRCPRSPGHRRDRAGRVVELNLAQRPSPFECRVQQVGLNTHGEQWARPFEDGRDCKPGRLAGLSRPDDHDRMASLGGEEAAKVGPENDSIARGLWYSQWQQVARARPPPRLGPSRSHPAAQMNQQTETSRYAGSRRGVSLSPT